MFVILKVVSNLELLCQNCTGLHKACVWFPENSDSPNLQKPESRYERLVVGTEYSMIMHSDAAG